MESVPLPSRQAWRDPREDARDGVTYNADGMPVIDSVPIRRGSYAVRLSMQDSRRSSLPAMALRNDDKPSSDYTMDDIKSPPAKPGYMKAFASDKQKPIMSPKRTGSQTSMGFVPKSSVIMASLPQIRRIPVRKGSYAQLLDSKKGLSENNVEDYEEPSEPKSAKLARRAETFQSFDRLVSAPGTAPAKARYSELNAKRLSTASPSNQGGTLKVRSSVDIPSTAPAKFGVLRGRRKTETTTRKSPESWIRPESSQGYSFHHSIREESHSHGMVSMPKIRDNMYSPQHRFRKRSSSNLEHEIKGVRAKTISPSTSGETKTNSDVDEGLIEPIEAEDEFTSAMLSELRDQLQEKEKNVDILVKKLVKTMRALDIEKKKRATGLAGEKTKLKYASHPIKTPTESVMQSLIDLAKGVDSREEVEKQLAESFLDMYRSFLLPLSGMYFHATVEEEDIFQGWTEWLVTQLQSPIMADLHQLSEREADESRKIANRIRQSWEWKDTLSAAPAGLCSWDLDIARHGPEIESLLVEVSVELFEDFGVLSDIGVERGSLNTLLSAVTKHHESMLKVPYHNFLHSFDVLHTCYMLLIDSGVSTVLNKLDIFALFLSAITADMRSDSVSGKSNYDESMLERSRISDFFRLIEDEGCNVFSSLNEEDERYVRRMFVVATLSTDMSNFIQCLSSIRLRMSTGIPLSQGSVMDHVIMVQLLMMTATHSWALKPFELCNEWVELLGKETLSGDSWPSDIAEQTKLVSSLGILLQHNIVLPLTELTREVFPELDPFDYILDRNRSQWMERLSLENDPGRDLTLGHMTATEFLSDSSERALQQKANILAEGIVNKLEDPAATERDSQRRLQALAKDSEARLKRMEKLVKKQEAAEQKREADRQRIGAIALSVKKAQSDKIMADAKAASVLGAKKEDQEKQNEPSSPKEQEEMPNEVDENVAAKNWLSKKWEAIEEQKRRHDIQKNREFQLRKWRKKAKRLEEELNTRSETMEKAMGRMQTSLNSKNSEVEMLRKDISRLNERLSCEVRGAAEKEAERGRLALLEQETNLKRRIVDWQKRFKTAESKADAVAELEARYQNEISVLTKKTQELNDRIKYEKSQRAIKEVSIEKQWGSKLSSMTATIKAAEARINQLEESNVMGNVKQETVTQQVKEEYEDKIRELKYQLDAAEKQSDEGLKAQLEVKNNVIRKLETDLEEQSRVVDQWMAEMNAGGDGVPTVAEEKSKQIDELKSKVSSSSRALKKAEKKVKFLEEKLKWEQDSTKALRTKLRDLNKNNTVSNVNLNAAYNKGAGSEEPSTYSASPNTADENSCCSPVSEMEAK